MQPGDSIVPDGEPNNQAANSTQDTSTDAPGLSSVADTASAQPGVPSNGWQYSEEDVASQPELTPVSWSASEYIDHEKRAGWFLSVAGIAIALGALIYFLTHDLINGLAIILVGGLFAVSGARRPRTLQYGLDARGIHIADRFYDYNDMKSFAVIDEGGINSIQLLQFKRFTTPITLYYPPEQEDAIVNFLGSYLPHEVRSHDPIDRLMRKVRF